MKIIVSALVFYELCSAYLLENVYISRVMITHLSIYLNFQQVY